MRVAMKVVIMIALLVIAPLSISSLAQTALTNTADTPATTSQHLGESEHTENEAPNSLHSPNAPTLAQLAKPDDNQLSRANIELLAKNSQLQGRIDELTTQVNVLVNERSGQLFLYGVISTLASFTLGFILASLIIKRK